MKALMKISTTIFFLLAAVAGGAEWSDKYLEKIKGMSDPPSKEDYSLLVVLASNKATKEDVKMVRDQAWQILQKNPDFPKELFARISDFKAEWKKTGVSNHYDAERLKIISALGELPEVQVVEMLGSALGDMEWSEDPIAHIQKSADYGLTPPNGMLAAQSLAKLVENPPINKNPENYLETDIEPWRLWFGQLKAGNRTFRFRGNPQEYRLTSSVKEVRIPKGTVPAATSREVRPSSAKTEERAASLPIWPLAFVGVLLAVAIWFATKRKSAAA